MGFFFHVSETIRGQVYLPPWCFFLWRYYEGRFSLRKELLNALLAFNYNYKIIYDYILVIIFIIIIIAE